MNTNETKQTEKGFALMIVIISIMTVSLIIGIGVSFLIYNSIVTTQNKVAAMQSYYTAESGIEDSLLRIIKGMNVENSVAFSVGSSQASVVITPPIGGSRTITAQGNENNRIRKIEVMYAITTDTVSFFYGAQAGEGGVLMGNGGVIDGNVYSNGSILPLTVGSTGEITGSVTVAGNGNKLDSIDVGVDAWTFNCEDSDVVGTLHFVTGVAGSGKGDCTASVEDNLGPNSIDPIDLPITADQITEWKADAAEGGTIVGDYTLNGGETVSLGPAVITGDLLIDNNSTLIMTGTIYVQGDFDIDNGATIELGAGYSDLSGIMISDGLIDIRPGTILLGSGELTSYIMLLSTNNSTDYNAPAVDVDNTAQGAIFYAANGAIRLHNGTDVREATGYQVIVNNNAVVQYESGLANANFTSGPGGSWAIVNWEEVE